MTTKDEALKQALDALGRVAGDDLRRWKKVADPGSIAWHVLRAIATCREALEQKDEQEPVAEITADDMGRPFNALRIGAHFYKEIPPVGTKLYTAPPECQPHNLNCTVFVYRHRETGAIRALYTEDARAMTGRDDYEHVASLEPRMWIEYNFDDAAKERQPMTDAGINEIADSMPGGLAGFMKGWGWQQFARAIEAAHGIGAEHEPR